MTYCPKEQLFRIYSVVNGIEKKRKHDEQQQIETLSDSKRRISKTSERA